MIEIKIKETKEFYSTMGQWCVERNFPLPPLSFLPKSTVVAYNQDGVPMYSTSIYNTDSGVLWIGWELSNVKIGREDRDKAFKYILRHIETYAKEQKYSHIFTTSNTFPIEGKLLSGGFIQGDTNVNQYIKNI